MVNGDWQGAPLDRLPKRPPWPQPVTTDDKGRFEVHGFNRDRGVKLRVSDERFASEFFELTSPGKPRPSQEMLNIDVAGNVRKHERGADEKGQALEPTLPSRNFVTAAAFTPDGTAVLTAGGDRTARLWSVPGALSGMKLIS